MSTDRLHYVASHRKVARDGGVVPASGTLAFAHGKLRCYHSLFWCLVHQFLTFQLALVCASSPAAL